MQEHRTNKLAAVLTALISFAYFSLLIGTVLLLIAAPILKVYVGDYSDFRWALVVAPTERIPAQPESVLTRWGPGQVEFEDARAKVYVPIGALPWSLFAFFWTRAAIAMGLMILFLHNLRRIFQRVRDGAPFDADNATRLRSLGVLLLVFAAFKALGSFFAWLVLSRGLESDRFAVPMTFGIDGAYILVPLTLIALAEVFRRGAELENEQSLVV